MSINKLKIGYFADGPWSHEAFNLMIKDFDIRFIVPRFDTKDQTLYEFAEQNKIDYFSDKNINSPEFIKKVSTYNCDIFVSMSFNQIFREQIINIPRYKTINCHAGKLPFYRGRNILNWALINDEKEFGITVHYIDNNVDTGDIILQRTYPITDEDNYRTLLLSAYKNCAKDLYDAIKLIENNKVVPVRQETIHPVGFYCGMRKEGDEKLNWKSTSREIFNFIRAICKPGPMATTSINGKPVKINKARMINNAPNYVCIPGQVVGKTKDGYIVKTLDSTLEISDLVYEGKIKTGDRFDE